MMARVLASEVLEIMNESIEESTVNSFIQSANVIVTKVFEYDTEATSAVLKEIERWLTAHMLVSTVLRMGSKEKIGEAEITYMGVFGKGLESTPYGQMVKTLDITGRMAQAGKSRASIFAIPNFEK